LKFIYWSLIHVYSYGLPHLNFSIICHPYFHAYLNPLNAKLNPICHLLALLEDHHILHVSRIRVKVQLSARSIISLYVLFFWAVMGTLIHCYYYRHFFTVPTNAQFTHFKTLKSLIKILNICPYMFRSLLKPSSGGS